MAICLWASKTAPLIGRLGGECRGMLASLGVRLPLWTLQRRQAVVTLSQL